MTTKWTDTRIKYCFGCKKKTRHRVGTLYAGTEEVPVQECQVCEEESE
jgi:hypothetical protein